MEFGFWVSLHPYVHIRVFVSNLISVCHQQHHSHHVDAMIANNDKCIHVVSRPHLMHESFHLGFPRAPPVCPIGASTPMYFCVMVAPRSPANPFQVRRGYCSSLLTDTREFVLRTAHTMLLQATGCSQGFPGGISGRGTTVTGLQGSEGPARFVHRARQGKTPYRGVCARRLQDSGDRWRAGLDSSTRHLLRPLGAGCARVS